jgi:iron complex outermembrane receptor protein
VSRNKARYASLFSSVAMVAVIAAASPVRAQEAQFSIAPQPLSAALNEFSVQSRHSVIFKSDLADSKLSQGVAGATDIQMALNQLLAGTGLGYKRDGDTFIIVQGGSGPQSQSAAGGGAEVEGLIVTAQKREENIQDVPIAMSAFSQEDLTDRQVAGGPDLITQIPNFSFTKTNFSGYSIQIRGIGTQAISATTDPAVAVAFNNTPFIRNRFFEQEFYDLERLEVLRGPQGTLYGRNATAGVVNIISAKPKFTPQAKLSVDLSNYSSSRLEGMVNIPLVEDTVALRLAAAWTKREGYAFNQMTGAQIDGRDLWSARASLRFEPNDWISANLVFEHFQEDDDRLRSGKQLCKKHVVTHVGDLPLADGTGSAQSPSAYVAQGCTAVSLYSEEAFQTPNADSLPYFSPLSDLGLPIFANLNPYLNATQSRDLRVIESSVEPEYRANTDIAELQIAIDLTDSLTLNSETAYGSDALFSLQDYNRFTTAGGVFDPTRGDGTIDANGVFCDPQLGCSDRLLLVDLSTSDSTQFSQEFRLGSDFDGPLNFSLGANFLRHDAEDKYYVFINTISLWAAWKAPNCSFERGHPGDVGETARLGDPTGVHGVTCPYMDPNPIDSLNDMGRNYFLSKNPYKLISYAAFGELYYNITSTLKLTGGLRFTVDKKTAPQIPSWLLAHPEDGPYPTSQTLVQEWREPTGRLALDWQPELGFTDQTLVYASYAHGYKAGGANPPPPVFATYGDATALGQEILPDTFGPEFIDAFEVGTKNTLFDGALTLNLTGFYYDYKGYQTSEIRSRSAVNSNFDAEVWGAEIEADWRPTEALRLGFKGGWQNTRMADGSNAVDLMDRTAGNPDWMVIRPFPTVPSNCVLPLYLLTAGGRIHAGFPISSVTSWNGDCIDAYYNHIDPLTQLPYVPDPTVWKRPTGIELLPAAYDDYPGFDYRTAPNGGRGFSKDLSGNELPNAPNYTATVTADYTLPLRGDWMMTLHGDYHYQSESWARVINSDPYDRIKAFSTVNASAIFTNDDAGWKVMAYVKNVFDETAITGSFLNSDDSGLTTNIFLTEPRLYGVRVTKDWTGSIFGWTGDGSRHDPGAPYPFQVEIGAAMSRFDGGAETYQPDWLTPALSSPLAIQGDDLDWGDIRTAKLTYAPANGWRVSAAYLYGKTNGQGRAAAYEDVPGGLFYFNGVGNGEGEYREHDNYMVSALHDAEEHGIVDFLVGKDVGLGLFGEAVKSTLSAGLRYASFKSTSSVAMNGSINSSVPEAWAKYTDAVTYDVYHTTLTSTRKFEGTGPSVSWESSLRLAGADETGHVDLDWSVTGGVLFGKRTSSSEEERFGGYYFLDTAILFTTIPEAVHYDDLVPRNRTEDASVPNLSLTLGVSYSVDRVKVSTGYAYDRFFDVIDGGYKDAQAFDRTIHGPYLKLSVGFGG